MLTADRKQFLLTWCLAALAGYIDAIGFIKMGGVFVSFMSGNSTRLAVGATSLETAAFLPGLIIFLFVAGVAAGTIIGHYADRRRIFAILSLVTVSLLIAAIAKDSVSLISASFMALAMGAVNTLFQKEGETRSGITYMTGTLVKMGQHLAATLWGGPQQAWLRYAFLWLGLVIGGCLGAWAYRTFDLNSLWFAVSIVFTLTVYTAFASSQGGGIHG